jgi:hypothetical protein
MKPGLEAAEPLDKTSPPAAQIRDRREGVAPIKRGSES